MRRTLLYAMAIMVTGMTLIFFIYSSNNRYAFVTGGNGQTYQLDKRSGQTWLIDGKKKISLDSPDAPRPILEEFELDSDKIRRINVEARISKGSLLGKVYNGSDLPLTRLVLSVTAKNPDGSVRWQREFTEGLFVKPLTTGRFTLAVTDSDDLGDVSSILSKAYSRPMTDALLPGR